MDASHIRWFWLAVVAVYLVAQTLAWRRLHGELKELGYRVLITIVVLTMIESSIDEVFENPEATLIAKILLGVAMLVAAAFLAKLMRSQKKSEIAAHSLERVRE
jgi:uncharacterized membrane protein YhaH (DUF805 family)